MWDDSKWFSLKFNDLMWGISSKESNRSSSDYVSIQQFCKFIELSEDFYTFLSWLNCALLRLLLLKDISSRAVKFLIVLTTNVNPSELS